jgi:ribosome-binding protein aMBF1 (putative translation factor)
MTGVVFLPTHTSRDLTAGYVCYPVVMYHNEKVQSIVSQVRHTGINIHERIARLERNPARAAALSRARQRLGAWIAEEMPDKGLAALRMKAGLSQAKLADLMGTQQSNISRWEKTPGDMQHSTMKKLAQMLGVSTNEVVDAIERQEQAQGETA